MTAPTKNDLANTLAAIRRRRLDEILERPVKPLPPGNADGLPPAYRAKPRGKQGATE